jgi:putative SOS response-associated peptidase YedK
MQFGAEFVRLRSDGKQPSAIALADRKLMALAGLWESWRSPAGERVRSFAIACPPTSANQARLPDSIGAFDAHLPAQLERGADRYPFRRVVRHQGSPPQSRHATLGLIPYWSKDIKVGFAKDQLQGRGDRSQTGFPRSVRAAPLPGAGRQFLRKEKRLPPVQPHISSFQNY